MPQLDSYILLYQVFFFLFIYVSFYFFLFLFFLFPFSLKINFKFFSFRFFFFIFNVFFCFFFCFPLFKFSFLPVSISFFSKYLFFDGSFSSFLSVFGTLCFFFVVCFNYFFFKKSLKSIAATILFRWLLRLLVLLNLSGASLVFYEYFFFDFSVSEFVFFNFLKVVRVFSCEEKTLIILQFCHLNKFTITDSELSCFLYHKDFIGFSMAELLDAIASYMNKINNNPLYYLICRYDVLYSTYVAPLFSNNYINFFLFFGASIAIFFFFRKFYLFTLEQGNRIDQLQCQVNSLTKENIKLQDRLVYLVQENAVHRHRLADLVLILQDGHYRDNPRPVLNGFLSVALQITDFRNLRPHFEVVRI